jgi:hypothetical protein
MPAPVFFLILASGFLVGAGITRLGASKRHDVAFKSDPIGYTNARIWPWSLGFGVACLLAAPVAAIAA